MERPRRALGAGRLRAIAGYDAWPDALLPLFGTGPVLDIGGGEPSVVEAWRSRGLTVVALDVASDEASLSALPFDRGAFGALVAFNTLEYLDERQLTDVLAELARVARRATFVRVATRAAADDDAMLARPRTWWESRFLDAGFARHPLGQRLTPFHALEDEGVDIVMAFERLPEPAASVFDLGSLATERDLHMDMLRESGRRSDAHIARYMLATEFVRSRDRVLDAACGLGYGAALIHDGTRAESVIGFDSSATAIRYAAAIYGPPRPSLSFAERDVASMDLPAGSADLVVSFETLEHIPDPRGFVRDVARLLTPGGRIVCSVPNGWVDETGRDPNPHHLHVFDLPSLLALFEEPFRIERVFGQNAGGGMKHYDAPRSIAELTDPKSSFDPEWWIVVAMKSPFTPPTSAYRETESAHPDAATWTVTAFERHYENPALLRSLVILGYRASSPALLRRIASEALAASSPSSPDRGGALCVLAYDALYGDGERTDDLLTSLAEYCRQPPAGPHVERWRISNEYVLGRLLMVLGSSRQAEDTFGRCASRNPLVFSPLLATKTVDAAFWAGWLALQRDDRAEAARWWVHGVHAAQQAAGAPWTDVVGCVERPLLFGLRELTQVLDLASRCASALHGLEAHHDRPGLHASLAFESLTSVADAQRRALANAHRYASALRDELGWYRHEADRGRSELLQSTAALSERRELDDRNVARLTHRALLDPRGIAVFGAGEGGRRLSEAWRRAGGHVRCIADNRSDLWNTSVHGCVVVSPADLPPIDPALIVIASSTGRDAIARQLEGLQYIEGVDFIDATQVERITG